MEESWSPGWWVGLRERKREGDVKNKISDMSNGWMEVDKDKPACLGRGRETEVTTWVLDKLILCPSVHSQVGSWIHASKTQKRGLAGCKYFGVVDSHIWFKVIGMNITHGKHVGWEEKVKEEKKQRRGRRNAQRKVYEHSNSPFFFASTNKLKWCVLHS